MSEPTSVQSAKATDFEMSQAPAATSDGATRASISHPYPPPPPPEIKPLPGESELDARTRAIHENFGESFAKQYVVGWHLAMVQNVGLYVGAGYPTFATYVEDKVPEISVAWAYVLVNVVNAFDYWDVLDYGISALNEVIKLCHTAVEFRERYMPVNLLRERLTFKDVDGRPITINFAEQHGIAHLKALVAIARAAAIGKKDKKPTKVSEATHAIEAAVKQAAEAVEGSAWSVRERHHKVAVELEVDPKHFNEFIAKLAELLVAAK